MSEIEKIKLYQNAGIEPTYTDECIIANRYWGNKELANEYGTFDKFMEKNCEFGYQDCTDECGYAYTKTHYSPFTAEKQLKLFLFVTSLGVCEIEDWKEKGFHFAIKRKNIYPTTFLSLSNINFKETIADIINNLWQDLTPEEKQQVKGILE